MSTTITKEDEKKEDSSLGESFLVIEIPSSSSPSPSPSSEVQVATGLEIATATTNTTTTATTLTTTKEAIHQLELFDYDEIIRGKCLGKGSFASVYEVLYFDNLLEENDATNATTTKTKTNKFDTIQLERRHRLINETKPNDPIVIFDHENFQNDDQVNIDDGTGGTKDDNNNDNDDSSIGSGILSIGAAAAAAFAPLLGGGGTPVSSPPSSKPAPKKKSKHQNKYVMKCLRDSLFDETLPTYSKKKIKRAAKDFEMECNLLSTISHPNIVKVYCKSCTAKKANECHTIEDSKSFFLIEDRLIATLDDQMDIWKLKKRRIIVEPLFFLGVRTSEQKKKLLQEEALFIAEQIANALAYLHSKRIIYRDLKSENVGFSSASTTTTITTNTTSIKGSSTSTSTSTSNNTTDSISTITKDYSNHQVKLFDFGLARRLPPSKATPSSSSKSSSGSKSSSHGNSNSTNANAVGKQEEEQQHEQHEEQDHRMVMNEIYKMSGKTGNLLLMAPEVYHEEEYNEKVDVHCFAILTWMMLSLELPYRELLTADMTNFHKKVMVKGLRPEIKSKWCKSIQLLLRKSWSKDITQRPSMKEICMILKERRMTNHHNHHNHTPRTPGSTKSSSSVSSSSMMGLRGAAMATLETHRSPTHTPVSFKRSSFR